MNNDSMYVNLAREVKEIYDRFHEEGFTEEQAFELTKSLSVYAFEKQAYELREARMDRHKRISSDIVRRAYELRRAKEEVNNG